MLASAVLLASCSSTSDPITRLGLAPQALAPSLAGNATTTATRDGIVTAEAQTAYSVVGEDDPVLPEVVDDLPTRRSGEPLMPRLAQEASPAGPATAQAPTQAEIASVVQTRVGPDGPALETVAVAAPVSPQPEPQAKRRGFFASLFGQPEQAPAKPAPRSSIAAATPVTAPAAMPPSAPADTAEGQPREPVEQAAAAPASAGEPAKPVSTPGQPAPVVVAATAFIENQHVQAAQPDIAGPKKRGFLSSFFSPAEAAPAPRSAPAAPQPAVAETAAAKVQPVLTLASTGPLVDQDAQSRALFSSDPLPGVRQGELFEIKRKSGVDDDSDIDLHEGGEEIEVASAAGLARLAPNGLLGQTERVDVACLKPSLVRVLKVIESHYGQKLLVTSGYRSPPINRQARGARNSLHMYCAAADVQVPGVTKWELAEFVRSMPGRGGVGTYCHTDSVHVDVGPERDWNWRCRKRRK